MLIMPILEISEIALFVCEEGIIRSQLHISFSKSEVSFSYHFLIAALRDHIDSSVIYKLCLVHCTLLLTLSYRYFPVILHARINASASFMWKHEQAIF